MLEPIFNQSFSASKTKMIGVVMQVEKVLFILLGVFNVVNFHLIMLNLLASMLIEFH